MHFSFVCVEGQIKCQDLKRLNDGVWVLVKFVVHCYNYYWSSTYLFVCFFLRETYLSNSPQTIIQKQNTSFKSLT